jgi:hypothetical protein
MRNIDAVSRIFYTNWFCGVVGYHFCLTHRRSWVRASAESSLLLFSNLFLLDATNFGALESADSLESDFWPGASKCVQISTKFRSTDIFNSICTFPSNYSQKAHIYESSGIPAALLMRIPQFWRQTRAQNIRWKKWWTDFSRDYKIQIVRFSRIGIVKHQVLHTYLYKTMQLDCRS